MAAKSGNRMLSDTEITRFLVEDRIRISGILESEEGKARPTLAAELALRSPMSKAAAIALLSKAAPESRHASAAEAFARALKAEAIGLTVLGAAPTGDAKEERLAEIKRNVGKGKRNAA